MKQSIKMPYEVIVVDSGKDNTYSIVQLISSEFNHQIIYIKCKGNNRSYLRNSGVKRASYNTLLFLDNDILLPKNYLELAVKKLTSEKSVVFGLRKSLARFDINILGKDFLTDSFEVLENFPYYYDTREKFLNFENIEHLPCKWRFGLSHSMMMKKQFFLKTKGFNKKFGKFWGYEDVEYCHRLIDSGAEFNFVTETYVYHQPHFSQSVNEQKQGNINLKKFLSIFNGYEEELVQTFGDDFDYFYKELADIRRKQQLIVQGQCKKRCCKNSIYLGWCLTDSEKKVNALKNFYLGVCLINYKDQSLKNGFVSSQFYKFPFEIQFLLIRETIRVCKNVYIEKIESLNSEKLMAILKSIGFECALSENANFYYLKNIKASELEAYNIILPDVENVSERFMLKTLAFDLIKQGYIVYVEDLRLNNEYAFDDYALDKSDNELLKKYERLNRVYMDKLVCGYETLNKYSFLTERGKKIELLDDTYFCSKNDRNLSKYYTFSKEQLNGINTDFIKLYAEKHYEQMNTLSEPENKYVLTFMENGFHEEGMAFILECFKKLIDSSNKNSIKLIIKIPDYQKLMSKNYPLHNDVSKELKNFDFLESFQNDFILLQTTIQNLGLCNSVEVLKENYTLLKVLKLIKAAEFIICSGVGKSVPVYVLASNALNKKLIYPEHFELLDHSDNAFKYKTTKSEVSNYFNIPFNMENIGKCVYLPDKNELLNLCAKMI